VSESPQTVGDSINPGSKWDLTRREIEVLEILRTGASDKEIASALGVSRFTVSKHVENILKKMKVPNRTAAASLSWKVLKAGATSSDANP
jgi:DNA-binding NarL/FixJ family response regulator